MAFSQYNLFGGVDPAPSEEPKTVPSELIMDILNEILPQDVVQDIVDGKATVIAVDITPAPESRPFRPAKAEWAQGLGFVSEPVDSPEDSKPSDE